MSIRVYFHAFIRICKGSFKALLRLFSHPLCIFTSEDVHADELQMGRALFRIYRSLLHVSSVINTELFVNAQIYSAYSGGGLPIDTATHGNTLQHTATHCNTLQHTATHCKTLQHTATQCTVPTAAGVYRLTWQPTATHCNTLQHTATHCNALQHTATHSNTLQHTATHCNPRQHTTIHCNKL